MSRFNLLMVNADAGARQEALKALSKVFRNNFVFEADSLSEAENLASKLHIDMVVVDVDKERPDFLLWARRYPHLLIVGISQQPRGVDIPMNVYEQRMLPKRDLQYSLLAELKTLRKGTRPQVESARRQLIPSPAESSDFRDFFVLVNAG